MIHKLRDIYPNSLLNPQKNVIQNIDTYFLVEIGKDRLYILKEQLKPAEIELLYLLSNTSTIKSLDKNPFLKLILNGVVDDFISVTNIQLIYLRTTHLEENNFSLWRTTLMDSLVEIIEVVAVTADLSIVILETQLKRRSFLKEFSDVVLSLDQDFSLLTVGMVGQSANVTPQIKEIFDYEKNVFRNFVQSSKAEGIIKLSDLLLYTIGKDFKKEMIELPALLNHLYNEKENQQLIRQLFENHGNLSQTANALYLHRNTLAYRIEQFYKKTGFDLTYLTDLIVCHLLIT